MNTCHCVGCNLPAPPPGDPVRQSWQITFGVIEAKCPGCVSAEFLAMLDRASGVDDVDLADVPLVVEKIPST